MNLDNQLNTLIFFQNDYLIYHLLLKLHLNTCIFTILHQIVLQHVKENTGSYLYLFYLNYMTESASLRNKGFVDMSWMISILVSHADF